MPRREMTVCEGSLIDADKPAKKFLAIAPYGYSDFKKVPGRGYANTTYCPRCGKGVTVLPTGKISRHSPFPYSPKTSS